VVTNSHALFGSERTRIKQTQTCEEIQIHQREERETGRSINRSEK